MKLRIAIYSSVAACSLLLSAGATAQTAPTAQPAAQQQSDRQLSSEDKDFLENAAQAGHTEIEGSKLAQSNATSADVKSFAEQMIKDHTKVAGELDALAKNKGYTPPAGPSVVQKGELKMLDMRDETFDSKYVDKIGISAHEDAVKLFQKGSAEAKDPDVKAFAAKNLPTLEHHLEMAESLKQQMAHTK